jgi:hypothetical protein
MLTADTELRRAAMYFFHDPISLWGEIPEQWRAEASKAIANPTIYARWDFEERDIQRLQPKHLSGDNLINVYSQMLRAQGAQICDILRQTPQSKDISYKEVLQHGQIFVPIYSPERRHWTFGRLLPAPYSETLR